MEPVAHDWPNLINELLSMLKLKSNPTGMKFIEDITDLDKIPYLKRPRPGDIHTACQLIGRATRNGATVAILPENLPNIQCRATLGMGSKEELSASAHMKGVWFEHEEDALAHQAAMYTPLNKYKAVVAFPLTRPVHFDPDIVLVYGSPQQIMLLLNAVQYEKFEVISMTFVGESSCSDSWAKAMATGKISVTIPCYGERSFGSVLDDEMIAAFPPSYMNRILSGLKKLKKNKFAYPAPYYGTEHDMRPLLMHKYADELDKGNK